VVPNLLFLCSLDIFQAISDTADDLADFGPGGKDNGVSIGSERSSGTGAEAGLYGFGSDQEELCIISSIPDMNPVTGPVLVVTTLGNVLANQAHSVPNTWPSGMGAAIVCIFIDLKDAASNQILYRYTGSGLLSPNGRYVLTARHNLGEQHESFRAAIQKNGNKPTRTSFQVTTEAHVAVESTEFVEFEYNVSLN
jgi:hypothetical protein